MQQQQYNGSLKYNYLNKWAASSNGEQTKGFLGRTSNKLGSLLRQSMWRKQASLWRNHPMYHLRKLEYPLIAQHRYKRSPKNKTNSSLDMDDLMHSLTALFDDEDQQQSMIKRTNLTTAKVDTNEPIFKRQHLSKHVAGEQLTPQPKHHQQPTNRMQPYRFDHPGPDLRFRSMALIRPTSRDFHTITNFEQAHTMLNDYQKRPLLSYLVALIHDGNLRIQRRRNEKLANLWYWLNSMQML